jgi:hypothetical protein
MPRILRLFFKRDPRPGNPYVPPPPHIITSLIYGDEPMVEMDVSPEEQNTGRGSVFRRPVDQIELQIALDGVPTTDENYEEKRKSIIAKAYAHLQDRTPPVRSGITGRIIAPAGKTVVCSRCNRAILWSHFDPRTGTCAVGARPTCEEPLARRGNDELGGPDECRR